MGSIQIRIQMLLQEEGLEKGPLKEREKGAFSKQIKSQKVTPPPWLGKMVSKRTPTQADAVL